MCATSTATCKIVPATMELTIFVFLAVLIASSEAEISTVHQGPFTSPTVNLNSTDVIRTAHPAHPETTTIVNVTLTSLSHIYLVDRHNNASVLQKRFDFSWNLVVEIPTARTVDLGVTTTIHAVHAANTTTMMIKDVVLTSSSSIYMVDPSNGRILEKFHLWRNVVVEVPFHAPGIGFTTAAATTTAHTDNSMVNTTTAFLCEDDAESNCWGQPDTRCFGVYETWAKRHCPVRCGYCPGHLPPCEDKLSICDQFESIVCAAPLYKIWAQTNCRKHCDLCGYVPTQPTAAAAADSVSTTTSSVCEDDPAVGCRGMPIEGCFGTSETWARQHCPLRCGFCKLCKNTINCGMYEDYICTLPHYKDWAQVNCPQRCGWC